MKKHTETCNLCFGADVPSQLTLQAANQARRDLDKPCVGQGSYEIFVSIYILNIFEQAVPFFSKVSFGSHFSYRSSYTKQHYVFLLGLFETDKFCFPFISSLKKTIFVFNIQ